MPSSSRGQPGPLIQSHAGWAASLFLLTLGVKFCLLLHLGTPMPFWDQWDGEGADMYIPYLEGHLTLADLFRAHNEHRIFFTHVWDVLLLWLNGQWDNQFQAAMNAVVHSATIAGLGVLLARFMGRQNWPFIWLMLALMALPPFAWENTVGGMQCQFYFLLTFSGLVIWWLGLAEPLSWRWWLGVATAVASLFTMASGFLAAVAAAGLAVFEILKDRRRWRRELPTLVAGLVITLAGLWNIPKVPHEHPAFPHALQAFWVALGQNLAWPWVIHPWFALVNLFPLGALAWLYFRSPAKQQRAEQMLLMIGLWVILQAAATAFGRSSEGILPASRYMDSFSLIMVADGLALVLLITRYGPRPKYQPVWTAGCAVWVVFCLSGLAWLMDNTWYNSLPTWLAFRDARLQTAIAFRATDNPQVIADVTFFARPFPRVDELVRLLRHPGIRQILPACVRNPLPVVRGDGADDGAFVTNGCPPDAAAPPAERCWGSYSGGTGVGAQGKFESLPINPATLPFLEIPVAGYLGAPGLSLELLDSTGKSTPVKSALSADGGWQNAFVKAPAGKFKVVARDESTTGWLAFGEPRELGRFSYWTICLLRAWQYFVIAGLGCLVLQNAWLFANHKRQRQLRQKA